MTALEEPRPMDFSLWTVEDTDERSTHKASCHCGTVQYEVTLKYPFPKYPVNKCTCSICTHNSYLLVYPLRQDLIFTKGLDNVGSYAWNGKARYHKFCKTCAGSLMIDFRMAEGGGQDPKKDILAVNVRMFRDIDLDAVEYTFFDGKSKIPYLGEVVDHAEEYRKVLPSVSL